MYMYISFSFPPDGRIVGSSERRLVVPSSLLVLHSVILIGMPFERTHE